MTTTVITNHTSSRPAPDIAPPPIGSSPEYNTSFSAVPADCPNAFLVHGQDANYEFVFQEVLAEDPESGCTPAAPYRWDWTATSPSGNSSACSTGTSKYDDEHVATGVRARASVWWQPYCSAWVKATAAGGTTTTFAWTPAASTSKNGITLSCDPRFQQTFGPSAPAFDIFQIEPVAAG